MPSPGFVRQRISTGYSPSLLPSIARRRLENLRAAREPERRIDLAEVERDFVAFCRHVRIVTKSGERVPLHFNAIQAIFNVERTGRDIVLKPRQIGFSTLELARDLWTFLCKAGARVVVVCQSVADGSPAKLISGVLQQMLLALREAGWDLKFTTEAWNEWVLPNGNSLRIVVAGASQAAASKKGRAGTITRLHLTETAFYEYAKETLNALLECVPDPSTGSEIVNESTANGAIGLFFENCKSAQAGQSANKFHFYAWFDHPEYRTELEKGESPEPLSKKETELAKRGVSPEQLKWRRLKIADKGGESAFDQEYPSDPETCFLVSGSGYFDSTQTTLLIAKATSAEPIETRKHGLVRIWERPIPGRSYVLALDSSEGTGGDPAAGVLLDAETGKHVATIDGQLTPAQLAEEAAELCIEYNRALIAPERNNHGHATLLALSKINEALLAEDKDPLPVYRHHDDKLGFPTDQVTRPQILSDFEDSHRKGLLDTTDSQVVSQLRTFVILNGKPQAAHGAHDDLVLAYAIAWCIRQKAPHSTERTAHIPSRRR
jgi:hypothetical protein